jgi:hypothetical protein
MYVKDGIAYAENPAPEIRLVSIRALPDYRLWLRFSDGQPRLFDFTPMLDKPCYEPLKDAVAFSQVYLDYGVPVWADGEIDLAPEHLYEYSTIIESVS